ncbi:MAG: molybdopterin dinucleotide binding domain-containing protein, partial [Candidatus Eiseniibacteriota bacterium]
AAAAAVAPARPPSGAPAVNGDGLWLLAGGTLFLQGSLSHRETLLPKLAKGARAFLHPDEAKRLGVTDGQMIELAGPGGAIRVPGATDADVPAGSVFVPYAYAEVELNRLGGPSGEGLRVRASRVEAPETTGARG